MRGLAALVLVALAACDDETPVPAAVAGDPAAPTYAGSSACHYCHGEAYAAWQESHHWMAMQPASKATVVGDFSGTRFEYEDVTYEFSSRDGKYFVRADDEDGRMRDFEITHTFGIAPLQQYLVSFPDGRKQALSVCWDDRPSDEGGQRWFHLYQDEAVDFTDALHWTGRSQNWNHMCADCHSTDLRKRYDASDNSFSTSWAEVTVGCEACHGPASQHVDSARRGIADASSLNAALDSQTGQIETCARCHARRGIVAEGFRPGDALLDHYRPALLDEGLYHADGQIQDEVYVYGSFLQSKMHQRGVRCTDCHNPHSARVELAGNAVCTQCHQTSPPARFPTLQPAVYDHPEHHFHEAGSESAQCVSCHMPAQNYMVIDGRRDHSFRIPRPDIAAATGAPNACNGCHEDRDAAWAATEIARRFPAARPPHYGEVLAAGRQRAVGASGRLAALAGDAGQPAIVRGTALSLLAGWGDADALAALDAGLNDGEPLVRLGSLYGLNGLPDEQQWQLAEHLLDDELLVIRIEAAATLAPMFSLGLAGPDQQRLVAALDDYVATERVNADRPGALTRLAGVFAAMPRDGDAERAFREALELDPDWVPALVNLADFYRARDRDTEAGPLLERAVSRAPDNGAVHHAYGLYLVRTGRADDAVAEFAESVALAPDNARYRYVYGVALNSTGRGDEAVSVLAAGLDAFPDDVNLLFALATIERDRGNKALALGYVDRLLELQPGSPQLLQLRNELQRSN